MVIIYYFCQMAMLLITRWQSIRCALLLPMMCLRARRFATTYKEGSYLATGVIGCSFCLFGVPVVRLLVLMVALLYCRALMHWPQSPFPLTFMYAHPSPDRGG